MVIGAQRRVTAHRTERGHLQHLTNTRSAAGNMTSAMPLPAVIIMLRASHFEFEAESLRTGLWERIEPVSCQEEKDA